MTAGSRTPPRGHEMSAAWRENAAADAHFLTAHMQERSAMVARAATAFQ